MWEGSHESITVLGHSGWAIWGKCGIARQLGQPRFSTQRIAERFGASNQPRSGGYTTAFDTYLGLVGRGVVVCNEEKSRQILAACGRKLFSSGIVLFSLGIYVLHVWWSHLGTGVVRYVVPAGGMAFVLAWLSVAWAAWIYGSNAK